VRGIPGTPFCSMGQEFWAGARKALAKGLLPLLALLLGTYPASAQSAEDASPPATRLPRQMFCPRQHRGALKLPQSPFCLP